METSRCRCRINLPGKHANIARSWDLFPKYASSTHLKSKTTAYIHIYVWYKYPLKQNCHIFPRFDVKSTWFDSLLCHFALFHSTAYPLLVSCIPSPGRVLTLWRLLHMLRHFDPPFMDLWKICIVSTPIFVQKWGKCRISTPTFCQNLAKCIVSTPFFSPFVAFRVNGRCWASLSKTQPRTPPGIPRWGMPGECLNYDVPETAL